MKNKNSVYRIISGLLENKFSKETEPGVQQWLTDENGAEAKDKALFEYWRKEIVDKNLPEDRKATQKAFKEVMERLGFGKLARIMTLRRVSVRIAAVAIPVMLIAGGYFFFDARKNRPSDVAMTEIAVANGSQEHVMLADGSEMWVNCGSSVRYPEEFRGSQREVYMEAGESYFKVARDEEKQFVVHTEYFDVRVLGTEFNINSYADNGIIEVTLSSGNIEVLTKTGESYPIEPGQQLAFNTLTMGVEITNLKEEIQNTLLWKQGGLYFPDSSLAEIFSTLERRFNVKIEADTALLSGDHYYILFSDNENVGQIMNILSDIAGGFSYETDGDRIMVRK